MKRLISAALALSLLGATAASAAPVHAPSAPIDYRYHPYRHHDDGNGAAIAAGIGFLALTAILASQQNRDRDHWYDRDQGWRDRDRDYGYGRYDRGYGYGAPYGGYRGW
jgi:hypothetical protein